MLRYPVSPGEEAAIGITPARLSHHVCHGFAPREVVGRLLVRSRIFGTGVGFVQYELGGVIRILQDVEAPVAGFLDGGLMVPAGCLDKGIYRFGLDPDMDHGDMHPLFLLRA